MREKKEGGSKLLDKVETDYITFIILKLTLNTLD